ncbi:NTP transferase domain-containing protein [Opitutaceae bacterium]|nr:NTP transferase domain-containing protein [Opitutaceae bacterium]MDB4474193.1 NTP transferase domain-containing protein [Opitutaceae bacterium]
MKMIAMIPARMGSQRLARKNMRELAGIPLIVRAIRKCKAAGVFDEIWVNSEHPDFATIAEVEGVSFHQRPEQLGDNNATSEQYVAEFLRSHSCDFLFQVHSIAPLLTESDLKRFVAATLSDGCDCMLSVEEVQIECALAGSPVNFDFSTKTNSQELVPIQRLSWSVTAWRRNVYLEAFDSGKCATYSGSVGFFSVGRFASLVIKTEADLKEAEALLPLVGRMSE